MRHVFIMEVSNPSVRVFDYTGIFSGYFYIDLDGTWNGTVFTMNVTDAQPHFFYFDTYRLENPGTYCHNISTWASYFHIPPGQDVLFTLNPVAPFWLGLTIY